MQQNLSKMKGCLKYIIKISFLCVVTGHWMKKTKDTVKSSSIIEQINSIGQTSCQLRCKNNPKCNSFGMEEDVSLGGVIDCFLLKKDDASIKDGVMKSLYVVKRITGCVNSNCRSDQNCVEKGNGYECICKNGSKLKNCALVYLSCNDIKKQHPTFASGMYLINPSRPVSVFCDLKYGRRGWMLIANITIPKAISSAAARKITDQRLISDDIHQLKQAASSHFRLNPVKLDEFDSKFHYLWFYCTKPSVGRTISIQTVKKEVLEYFMKKTTNRPRACSSYERNQTIDNSRLSIQCGLWDSNGKWSSSLYVFPFYRPGLYHYGLSGQRLECDDQAIDGNNIYGTWRIYVS